MVWHTAAGGPFWGLPAGFPIARRAHGVRRVKYGNGACGQYQQAGVELGVSSPQGKESRRRCRVPSSMSTESRTKAFDFSPEEI